MKRPAFTGEGVEEGAFGLALMVATVAAVFVAYKTYSAVKAGVAAVGQATTATGEAIGGGIFTVLNGDANAGVQSVFQEEKAALAKAGYPPNGSDEYNRIVASFQGG